MDSEDFIASKVSDYRQIWLLLCTQCGKRHADGIIDAKPVCGNCWMNNYFDSALMVCGVCGKPDAVTHSKQRGRRAIKPLCLSCAQDENDDLCTKCAKRFAEVYVKDQRLCGHCHADWEFEQWLDARPPKQ